MELVLIKSKHDGLCWAVCKRGSWVPLMVFQSLAEAKAAK